MPRVLSLYITKEITVPFLLSVVILTATALLSKAIKIVELMMTYGVGAGFVARFVVSVLPSFLIYTIPVSFLIGVLVAFTRLSSDSEITAVKASGVSLYSVVKPVAVLSVAAYLATLLLTLYAFPWGNRNLKSLLADAGKGAVEAAIQEKTFYDRFPGVVVYVDRKNIEEGYLEGIFVNQEDRNGASTVIFAPRGAFARSGETSPLYLRLYDGTVHSMSEEKGSYHLARFSTYTLKLEPGGDTTVLDPTEMHNRELYPGELAARIDKVADKGWETAPFVIDFHKRFALPASVFVFAVLGVPLGLQRIRAARLTGFSVALTVVLLYYLASTGFEALGESGRINAILAVWGSDLVFFAFGVYVFIMAAKDRSALSPLKRYLPQ